MSKKKRLSSRAGALVLAGLFWPTLRPVWTYAGYSNKATTTPDFVQDGFGPVGDELPYEGLQFCCPTAAAMSLSYLAGNGFSQLGPANPTSAEGLNLIDVLSGFMNTNPALGTASNTAIINGIDLYLDAKGISSSNYTTTAYAAPTLSELATLNQNQTVVDLICGYYNTAGQRTGGHCVALDSQGVNMLGQSSPSTLVINNPKAGTFAPFADTAANTVQYDNTIATSGNLTSAGAIELDPSQYPGYSGTSQTVIQSAIALTVNAAEQSANNPSASVWTLSTTQSLDLDDGSLSVLAPLQGIGGISEGTAGVLDLQASDSTSGANTVVAGSLESNIASGLPFGSGSIALESGTLELLPSAGAGNVNLVSANGSGSAVTFSQGASVILNANGNNSLTFTIGGNTDGITPNLSRVGNGTLVINAADGTANLGTIDRLIVSGSGGNLPAVTNGIVAPYIVGQNNDANASGDFLTYSVNGFAIASYTTSGTSQIDAAGSTAIYQADANQSLAANEAAQVYALKLDGVSISGGANSTLNVGPQGTGQVAGIIFNGGSINTPNLNFGAAEGLVYTSNANGNIASVIQGSGGLTTFGPGALTLSGNNTYTGNTNIESGTLIAANNAGSATSGGSINVFPNATLEIAGAAAQAGGSGTTTISPGGTLYLNGGTLAGTLIQNGTLQGQGTISGPVTLNGSITSTATGAPANITFTNSLSLALGNSTIYSWQLNALDDKPANAGTNWSLLNFTDGSQVYFGNGSANPFHIDMNLGASVPDPNSGNPFWNVPHQWLIAAAQPYFEFMYYYYDFPNFAQGSFSVTNSTNLANLYAQYTPFAQPQGALATTWNGGSGSWANAGNWLANVTPQAVGDTANFTLATAAPVNITLDADWILGNINFNNSASYTLAAGTGGMLTLANGQLNAQITDAGGTHTISAPMLLYSNLVVAANNAADTMNLSGQISGPSSVTSSGNGTVILSGSNTYQGATDATQGTLLIASPAALPATTNLTIGTSLSDATVRLIGGGTSTIAGLTINPGSTLDVTTSALVINFSSPATDPIATIRAELQSGCSAGKWNGPGIISSNAAADPTIYAVGYSDGNTNLGSPAGANQIYIRLTIAGNANMDGIVNFPDLLLVAENYGKTSQNWGDGDFNYDGIVNFPDLLLLAENYGKQLSAGQLSQLPLSFNDEWKLAQTEIASDYERAVPEPGMIGLLFLGTTILAGRRRPLK
jgi:autotransporter-associated beta strand protein